MKVKEFSELSLIELRKMEKNFRLELLNLVLQKSAGSSENRHKLSAHRQSIARIQGFAIKKRSLNKK